MLPSLGRFRAVTCTHGVVVIKRFAESLHHQTKTQPPSPPPLPRVCHSGTHGGNKQPLRRRRVSRARLAADGRLSRSLAQRRTAVAGRCRRARLQHAPIHLSLRHHPQHFRRRGVRQRKLRVSHCSPAQAACTTPVAFATDLPAAADFFSHSSDSPSRTHARTHALR